MNWYRLILFLFATLCGLQISLAQGYSSEGSQSGETSALINQDQVLEDTAFLSELSEQAMEKIQMRLSEPEAKKKFSGLKSKISKMAYEVAISKKFLEGKFKVLLFEYPDAIVVDFFLRFVKYSIAFPLMLQAGLGTYIPIVEVIPEGGLITIPYLLYRIKAKRKLLTTKLGIDPKKLRAEAFPELNLNDDMLHVKSVNGEVLILPMQNRQNPEGLANWLSTGELEKLVPWRFVEEARKLNFDSFTYESILLDKALENRYVKKLLFSKFSYNKDSVDLNTLRLYNSVDLYLRKLQKEVEESKPRLGLSAVKIVKWIKGQIMTFQIGKMANEIQFYQLKRMAEYHNQNIKTEDKNWSELAELKNKSESMLNDLRVLSGLSIKLRCEALMIGI